MAEILTESFCERCGTRYTFESARPQTRLKGVKVFSRGLKNFVLSDSTSMDEAMASARSETDREATSHQLDAFHKTFNFCMSCRQYTCPNCWNEAEARCLTCAPLSLPEAPSVADLRDFREAALFGDATLIGEVAQTNGLPDHDHVFELPAGPFAPEASAAVETPPAVEAVTPVAEPEVLEVAEELPVAAEVTPMVAEPAEPVTGEWTDGGITDEEQVAEVIEPVTAEKPLFAEARALAAETFAADEVEVVEPAAPESPAALPADPAGKAAAQTTGLLQRFRPGQSLDDTLAAFERERADAVVDDDAEVAAAATTEPAVEPELAPVDEVAAAPVPEPVFDEIAAEPEPVEAGEPEAVEAAAEPIAEEVTVEPPAEDSIAATAEPQAVEPEPEIAVPAPPQAPLDVPEPEPAPLAAAVAEDVVEQPTWRITAPDPTAQPAPRPPAGGETVVPLQASGTPTPAGEPQWPAQPEWRSSTPAAGLPFLGRPAAPQGGIDALWAASNQELATAAPSPQGKAASGIQPCISCGLSLSANARFCRRCGTLQGR